MSRIQTAPTVCASYPPPQHYDYHSENSTINIPPLPIIPTSPTSPSSKMHAFLSPRRRRTTLGSPSRQVNPSLSPIKSHTNLRAAAQIDAIARKHTSTYLSRGTGAEKQNVAMVRIAARNTFRGRENEVVDWDREVELSQEGEMPSPFIRRRRTSRISAGLSRS